jgi:hypothetical protein
MKNKDENLDRIADALERIADALEAMGNPIVAQDGGGNGDPPEDDGPLGP